MILIHPPVVKPSEPPAGILKLAGALAAHDVPFTLLDANLEGMLYLMTQHVSLPSDTWTSRAVRGIRKNLAFLRNWQGYENVDRYRRAVADVNRALEKSTSCEITVSLADYADAHLSPVKSTDLLHAAEHPEENVFYPYFSPRLSQLLEKTQGEAVIGVSLNYLSQAISTFAMIGYLRKRFQGTKIILGGSLLTSWMRNPRWNNPFDGLVDHLVSGPGEAALLSLLGMPGHTNDFLPRPDGLPLDRYLAPGLILPYAASRGCYWQRCSFCPEKTEGARFSPTSKHQVVTDLMDLSARYHPALIHLVDSALSPALLAAFAEESPGSPWYGFVRITEELTDEDFCRHLRQSGCAMLKLGLESGDQQVLDTLDKGLDLARAARALATLKRAGIGTYVYLLFGTPAETQAAAARTLSFVARHNEYIDFLNLAIFNLPINCPEAETLDTHTFYEGDLSLYVDFKHPEGWNRREVRRFLDRELRTHPAIRPILLRHPPFFTSNHAPLFSMQHPGSGQHFIRGEDVL